MAGRLRVLVAGAGIGGLTCALALLRKGFEVEVLEKSPVLGEVGAGVQISPNGMRVLASLGVEPAAMEVCFIPKGREMRLWNTGDSCRRPAGDGEMVQRFGYPHITIHRADLHGILLDAVRQHAAATIRLDANCIAFEQDEAGVTVRLADGETVQGDVLIGADGIHSTIRRQMFGVSSARFTGGLAWRGVIPIERLPEHMRDRTGQTWVGPHGHFTVYPIRRGELINVVGHTERSDWQVESWYEIGKTSEFAEDFQGWHPEIQTLIQNIDTPYKWALFLHDTLKAWSKHRVTLLGDACHPMLPYLAQGANMALEDGIVLARCLDAHADDIPLALQCYERLRIPRTTRVVDESAANQHRYHHPSLADPVAGKAYIDTAWDDQMELRAWVFAYDATTVPIAEGIASAAEGAQ